MVGKAEAKKFVLYMGHLGRREPAVQPPTFKKKEIAHMKRLIVVLSVAALMGAMMVATAVPAFAQSYADRFYDSYFACQADPACYMQGAPTLKHGEEADVIGQNAQQNLPGTVNVPGVDTQQDLPGTVDVLGPNAPAWVS